MRSHGYCRAGDRWTIMADYVNISIPRPLYERCEELIQGTGFRSVTEFIVFVMRETVAGLRGQLTDDAESKIVTRLKALGYLG